MKNKTKFLVYCVLTIRSILASVHSVPSRINHENEYSYRGIIGLQPDDCNCIGHQQLSLKTEEANKGYIKKIDDSKKKSRTKEYDALSFTNIDCLSDPQLPSSPLKIYENDIQSNHFPKKRNLAIDIIFDFQDETVEFVFTIIQDILISERIGYFPFFNISRGRLDESDVQEMCDGSFSDLSRHQLVLINNLNQSKIFYRIIEDVKCIEMKIITVMSSFIYLNHLLEFMLTYRTYFLIELYQFMSIEKIAHYIRKGYSDEEIISEIVSNYRKSEEFFRKYIADTSNYDDVCLAICMNNDLSYMLFHLINNTKGFNEAIESLKKNFQEYKNEIEFLIKHQTFN